MKTPPKLKRTLKMRTQKFPKIEHNPNNKDGPEMKTSPKKKMTSKMKMTQKMKIKMMFLWVKSSLIKL